MSSIGTLSSLSLLSLSKIERRCFFFIAVIRDEMSPESHMILCFASPELRKQSLEAFILYRNSGTMSCIDLPRSIAVKTPKDVDKLRSIGMKTIFCLQQDSDLAYFRVDIGAIQEYVKTYDDIEHLRAEIRDFDSYDLRLRLPVVLSKLYNAINQNGGATYVHCTAGLGRAPAAARIPLEFNEEQGSWFLKRKLPEGGYEYKYIIDGGWTHNKHEPFTSPNKDGHVVGEDPNSASAAIRKRMAGDDPQLTTEELSLTISQHSAREVMLAQSGHVFLDRYVPSNQLSLDLSKMSFRTVDEPPLCPALEFCF